MTDLWKPANTIMTKQWFLWQSIAFFRKHTNLPLLIKDDAFASSFIMETLKCGSANKNRFWRIYSLHLCFIISLHVIFPASTYLFLMGIVLPFAETRQGAFEFLVFISEIYFPITLHIKYIAGSSAHHFIFYARPFMWRLYIFECATCTPANWFSLSLF